MKTTHCLLTLALAAMTLFLSPSYAQLNWEKCGSFPNRISVIYFYNDDLGFVAIGVPAGGNTLTPAIYRTLDGGKTWAITSTPAKASYGVNEILMEDKLNGWAAGDHTTGRIWHTTDGGGSWNIASSPGSGEHLGNSIRRTIQGLVVSDFLGADIELSTDEGRTFHTVYRPPHEDYILGMDFTDSIHGAAATTFRSSNKWAFTEDGGLSWHESNYGTESWSLRAMKGTSTFFAIPEGLSNTDDYLSEVMRSQDYGQTWNKIRTLPFRATSDVEIGGSALYIQTGHGGCTHCQYPEGMGIYRSFDSGMTWHGLGGPDYWSDTRFAVIPSCYGTAIFCSDIHNNVYRAFDTMIGTIKKPDGLRNTTINPPAPLFINSCKGDMTRTIIHTQECYMLVIEKEIIEGRDSEYFVLSGDPLPFYVTGNFHSILITARSQSDSGTFEAVLHIKGYYDYGPYGKAPFDTLLPLHLTNTGVHLQLQSDKNAVIFSQITPCSLSPDQTLTLRNEGCDTLMVISGPGIMPPQFTFEPVALPFVLAPDESKTFHVHFAPDSTQKYTAVAIFRAERKGKKQDLIIPLEGERKKILPQVQVSNSEIYFQKISLCDPFKDASFFLKNLGCDTLEIISRLDTLDPEFIIDPISLPMTLYPGQSIVTTVSFHPKKEGSYSGYVTYTCRNNLESKKISVRINGSAEPQFPQLVPKIEKIDFGLHSTCEQPADTSIIFTNYGCDSLSIISGSVSLPPEFTMDKISFPIQLAPGSSFSIHFHFHPSGDGNFIAYPEFIAERFGNKNIIRLSLIGKGAQGTAILRTAPTTFTFSPKSICSLSDSLTGIIANSGCDTLIINGIVLSEEGTISRNPISLPATVLPGDTLFYKIFFTPTVKGDYYGKVTITARSAHDTKFLFTSIIPVSAVVENGNRILQVFPAEIDFGSHSLCTSKDTIITLRNTGCDTIEINNAAITGSGFKILSNHFPIILPPGNTTILPLASVQDTVGRKMTSVATLSLLSNADNSIPPIHLQKQYIYPANHKIMLSGGVKNAAPGDTILLELLSSSQMLGVHTLDLDLTYNTDLLNIFKVSGPNSATFSEGHLHLEGNPDIISENGTLAVFTMCVYVTKESSTKIAINELHLNAFDPPFEECTAIASISGEMPVFTSSYSCGDKTISDYLGSSSAFQISSSYPNPAKDQLTIDIDSKKLQDISITVFDAFGRAQLSKQLSLIAGKHNVILDLTSISSGMYIVDVTNGSSRSSIHFVRIK